MSLDILSTTRIIVKEQVNDWTEAITIASQPLLQEQIIEQGYVQAMIDSVNELGPYIVIAPEIAIAHARPNNDVHQVGLSLLKLNQHVAFCDRITTHLSFCIECHRQSFTLICITKFSNRTGR